MKYWGTLFLLPSSLLLVSLVGCVSSGRFNEVQAERDQLVMDKSRLERRVERLTASTKSLDRERVQLMEGMEDLRQTKEKLESSVRELSAREAKLSQDVSARDAEFEELRGTYDGLLDDLASEVASGQIEIEQLREGLRLNLSQEILFLSGSASLNQEGIAVLRKVAERLKALPNPVEVRGHTDNVAVSSTSRYRSNWELAAARSAEVVGLFIASGVAPERLSVVSRAQFDPVASNDTQQGRAKNRRIEIRLRPAEAPPAEPHPPDEG